MKWGGCRGKKFKCSIVFLSVLLFIRLTILTVERLKYINVDVMNMMAVRDMVEMAERYRIWTEEFINRFFDKYCKVLREIEKRGEYRGFTVERFCPDGEVLIWFRDGVEIRFWFSRYDTFVAENRGDKLFAFGERRYLHGLRAMKLFLYLLAISPFD